MTQATDQTTVTREQVRRHLERQIHHLAAQEHSVGRPDMWKAEKQALRKALDTLETLTLRGMGMPESG